LSAAAARGLDVAVENVQRVTGTLAARTWAIPVVGPILSRLSAAATSILSFFSNPAKEAAHRAYVAQCRLNLKRRQQLYAGSILSAQEANRQATRTKADLLSTIYFKQQQRRAAPGP